MTDFLNDENRHFETRTLAAFAKLFVVQSKWRTDGVGSITQDEMSNFAQGFAKNILGVKQYLSYRYKAD